MSVPGVRRIVVGVDGSVESVAALRWACREASLRGAEVHAVHVREEHCRSLASYAVPALPAEDDVSIDIDDIVRTVQATAPRFTSRRWTASPRGSSLTAARARTCWSSVRRATCQAGCARPGPVIRACLRRAPCPVVVISAAQDPVQRRAAAAHAAEARAKVPAVVGG